MQAVILKVAGGPEVLHLEEVAKPVLVSGTDVLIRLKAAGINPIDGKIRSNPQKFGFSLPAVLGFDGAGVVEAVGAGVTRFRPGDGVYFYHACFGGRSGTYGEYAVVAERYLAHKPDALDFPEAAAVPLALITAWEALFYRPK